MSFGNSAEIVRWLVALIESELPSFVWMVGGKERR